MGVDCKVQLPGDVRVCDAAEVIGILAGLPTRWSKLGERCFLAVTGASAVSTGVPGMAEIKLEGGLVDGESSHSAYWHFETHPYRTIMPRSTPFSIAVARGLVDFFGGEVDYDDSDDTPCNYSRQSPRPSNCPEDGKPWEDFQKAKASVPPLTRDKLAAVREFAAYK